MLQFNLLVAAAAAAADAGAGAALKKYYLINDYVNNFFR